MNYKMALELKQDGEYDILYVSRDGGKFKRARVTYTGTLYNGSPTFEGAPAERIYLLEVEEVTHKVAWAEATLRE